MQNCFINDDRFNKVVIKAETAEAAERKEGYQNYECWIDTNLYKNPMEMDVWQWNANLKCGKKWRNKEKKKNRMRKIRFLKRQWIVSEYNRKLRNWENLTKEEVGKLKDLAKDDEGAEMLEKGFKSALKEWKADHEPLNILKNYGIGGGLQNWHEEI